MVARGGKQQPPQKAIVLRSEGLQFGHENAFPLFLVPERWLTSGCGCGMRGSCSVRKLSCLKRLKAAVVFVHSHFWHVGCELRSADDAAVPSTAKAVFEVYVNHMCVLVVYLCAWCLVVHLQPFVVFSRPARATGWYRSGREF